MPKPPRSPDRQVSLERRRRCATSGVVPNKIAASFTTGETAVLSVIARAVQKTGQCMLHVDAIAGLAGVCRTTVQNTLRLAERLGLIQRRERRRPGWRSDTNILTIVSPEWRTWLRLGAGSAPRGLKSLSATSNQVFIHSDRGLPAHERGHPMTQPNARRAPTGQG